MFLIEVLQLPIAALPPFYTTAVYCCLEMQENWRRVLSRVLTVSSICMCLFTFVTARRVKREYEWRWNPASAELRVYGRLSRFVTLLNFDLALCTTHLATLIVMVRRAPPRAAPRAGAHALCARRRS